MTRKGLQLRLPPDVKTWVENEAIRNGSSQNSEIVRALRAAMGATSTGNAVTKKKPVAAKETNSLNLPGKQETDPISIMSNKIFEAKREGERLESILKDYIRGRFDAELERQGISIGSRVIVVDDWDAPYNSGEYYMELSTYSVRAYMVEGKTKCILHANGKVYRARKSIRTWEATWFSLQSSTPEGLARKLELAP